VRETLRAVEAVLRGAALDLTGGASNEEEDELSASSEADGDERRLVAAALVVKARLQVSESSCLSR
jgi:hypothetical protein